MEVVTHRRTGPAGPGSVLQSSWLRPAQPPPSSPPDDRSPSGALLAVHRSLARTLQSGNHFIDHVRNLTR